MNESFQKHSSAWVSFSYFSFGAAAVMLALGIYLMPLDLWGKGYLTMGILMLVQTTVCHQDHPRQCRVRKADPQGRGRENRKAAAQHQS